MANGTERLRRNLDGELGALEAALGRARVDAELDVCSALANETRYTLTRVLVAAGEKLCVCELHAVVDVSESGLSHALSTLGVDEVRDDVDVRDWALADPDGQAPERVRESATRSRPNATLERARSDRPHPVYGESVLVVRRTADNQVP